VCALMDTMRTSASSIFFSPKRSLDEEMLFQTSVKRSGAARKRPRSVFGLRGTLLERLHASKLPTNAAIAPQHSFGLHKVWLRPHALETLVALSEQCDLALWSSTTARNTNTMVQEIFGYPSPSASPSSSTKSTDAMASLNPKSSGAPTSIPFKFVWTREHTSSDDFRRLLSSQNEDEFATLKDLNMVVSSFPDVSMDRVVLVDDTPSKSRLQAGNLIWLEGYGEHNLEHDDGLIRLQQFILKDIVPAPDVRNVLPKRL
jgi:hypothetical protein